MNSEELDNMYRARHLLPEPAPKIVGELIDELRRIMPTMGGMGTLSVEGVRYFSEDRVREITLFLAETVSKAIGAPPHPLARRLDDASSTARSDVERLTESFPFEYRGGGYFRRKGIETGVKADVLHGGDAVRAAIEHALESIGPKQSPRELG